MNVVLIILIIVILIIGLYIVYYVGFSSGTLVDLSKATDIIPSKDITNPTSTSFTYGLWLYVNTWNGYEKLIVEARSTITHFKLYLASSTPTLNVSIHTTDAPANNPTKIVTITNNFPIQRWVYIVVSVEGPIVDCYLDGKLVKSQQLQYLPKLNDSYAIFFGAFDAFLTKFFRIDTPSDPQTVWNGYMTGNGFSPAYGPGFGFKFEVTKDKKPIANYIYE